VYLSTGYNDPRVAPFQPGKMAARLQAATTSGRPVISGVDFDAVHGIGSTRSQRERELAEQLAFFYADWKSRLRSYWKIDAVQFETDSDCGDALPDESCQGVPLLFQTVTPDLHRTSDVTTDKSDR
jgi:hypothetical protein